ncbi:MAG: T9SS type A sorting domain-containing protein [Bacteroidota bacterium]
MKRSLSLVILALILTLSANAQLQKINTFAGTGTAGYNGDGGAATGKQLNGPYSVAVDAAGNVYVVDFFSLRVRKVATNGVITTVAGTGSLGYTGDGSIATSANLHPHAVTVDKTGNIYIVDGTYGVVRKVTPLGFITTIAGNGINGYTGDNGPALGAMLNRPHGITIDSKGRIIIADAANEMVRRIDAAGVITKIAGSGIKGYSGDGALAVSAQLDSPFAVTTDRKGSIYVADMLNHAVRKIDTFGIITTYAGTGVAGYTGDNGAAALATLDGPAGLTTDSIGNLYIADANNNVIRKVDTFGVITTAVGNGTPGFGGDLGYVNGANLRQPYDVAIDAAGSLYIADASNHRIRKTYATVGITATTGAGIEVYPNPAGPSVYISGTAAGDHIALFNLVGQQVSSAAAGNSEVELSVKQLPAGMYLLQVTDAANNIKTITKLVKE